MNVETVDLPKKRYLVSIVEIRQELVWAEEFSGRYARTLTLADGTSRTVELTPVMRDGMPVVELKDSGFHSYLGLVRVGTAATTNGNLMVRIADLDDLDEAREELRSRLPVSPVLPPATSLLSIADFVPEGFVQGIEILNDDSTPMGFVAAVLRTHLGLSSADSNEMMLRIHKRGGALVPTSSLSEAERIAAQITAEAAKHGHPLICRPVSTGP